MLPNDALILATAKHYGIATLATLDKDFAKPTRSENIKILGI